MERNNVPHQEIVDIFEKSVVDTFSVAEDYLALWTAYADYFRRRATGDSELGEVTGTDCENRREELLELFRRARTKMKTDYGIDGDPKDVLSRYHANMVTNVTEGRSIWDNVMTRHGREAQYWLDFIAYVRSRQKSEKCRKFYQQAVNSVTDDPRHVCEAYLQYEREEGSLESYEAAVKRTRAQLDRIKDREDTAAERGSQRKEQTWWNIKEPSRKPRQGRRDDKEQQQQQTKKKQWSKEGAGRGQSGGKREQRGDSKGKSGDRRDTQRKRKAAVLEHEDDDDGGDDKEARKVLKASDRGGDTAPVTEQKEVGSGVVAMDTSATTMDQEGPQPVGKKEERTVFVSNLAAAVTEQHLKEHFKECGDLVEVRLVHSKRGLNRINTFAYLEFMDPPAVWKALNLDHSTIIDRPIYVSPFKEKGDKPGGRPTRSYDNSCTVYVNNLQRDATEDALLQLFKQCGDIKEVRLVRGQNDRPKGYAYVEYLEKASALEAVNKLDSHQLGFKKIGVAMSAPRKTVESQSPEDGGGAKKDNEDKKAGQDGSGFLRPLFAPRRALQESTDAPVPRRSKTNLMLVPRVLSKGGKEAAEDKGREASKGKLSNDDFRKLFSSSKQV